MHLGQIKMFDFSPLIISLETALLASVLTFFAGIFAAYAMSNYKGKFKGLVEALLTLPLVFPPTVTGFFLLFLFGKNGPLGKLLYQFGINIIFTKSAIIIAGAVVSFPLMYKTTIGAFEQIDENLINAAKTLGVSNFYVLRKVILPLAWPGIASGTVLSFMRAIGEFGATIMIAGNIPGQTQTIPIAIYYAVEGNETNLAISYVGIVVVLSIFVLTGMSYIQFGKKRFKK